MREQQVLQFLSGGMSDRQIAEALGISIKTARRHLQKIYRKLGVTNRADAVGETS